MVKIIKKTIYYEGMPLRPLKVGKVSIVLGRNLIKKRRLMLIYRGYAKNDPIYRKIYNL